MPRDLAVQGTNIRWELLGAPFGSPLLLVHGGTAHSGWWEETVPYLRTRSPVALMDLSGHGDSGRRPDYLPTTWADEIAAVAAEVESETGRRPAVIAHSMGGRAAITAVARNRERFTSLILVEAAIRRPGAERHPELRGMTPRPLRVYPALEDALAAFKFLPKQPPLDAAVMRRLGMRSVREVEGGWSWKYDPGTFARFDDDFVADHLGRVAAPVGLIYGSESPFATTETWTFIEQQLGSQPPLRLINRGHHHVMLDHPAEVADAIADLAGKWAEPDQGRPIPLAGTDTLRPLP
jgi:pimeloyl-ACP methyl ester carboxylesterase